MWGDVDGLDVEADDRKEADAMHLAAQIALAAMQRPDIASLALSYAAQMICGDISVVHEPIREALH